MHRSSSGVFSVHVNRQAVGFVVQKTRSASTRRGKPRCRRLARWSWLHQRRLEPSWGVPLQRAQDPRLHAALWRASIHPHPPSCLPTTSSSRVVWIAVPKIFTPDANKDSTWELAQQFLEFEFGFFFKLFEWCQLGPLLKALIQPKQLTVSSLIPTQISISEMGSWDCEWPFSPWTQPVWDAPLGQEAVVQNPLLFFNLLKKRKNKNYVSVSGSSVFTQLLSSIPIDKKVRLAFQSSVMLKNSTSSCEVYFCYLLL